MVVLFIALIDLNNRLIKQIIQAMEYHLRCNRFRAQAEKMPKPQLVLGEELNRMAKPSLELVLYQNRTVMMTPQRPKNLDRMRASQQLDRIRSAIADPESDKLAFRKDLSHLTAIKDQRPERNFSTPKENTSYCISESSETAKKRKSHFLTVVSRLPGMSKSKKINFP